MKTHILFSVLFLFISTQSPLARADESSSMITKCGLSSSPGKKYGYCIYKIKESISTNILYYMHGLGGSEYEWTRRAAIIKFYKDWGVNAPTVIGISYGTLWALAEKNASQRSGLFEDFVNRAMPEVEAKVGFAPTGRTVVGLSMGGFNGSQLYLKRPELFQKVALLCPVITSVGPYSTQQEIRDYVNRTGAYSRNVRNALYFVKSYFPSQAAWNQSAPLTLAQSLINASFPALFVSAGTEDQYGIEEGSQKFTEIALSKGARAEVSLVKGYHCTFDLPALERFLKQ